MSFAYQPVQILTEKESSVLWSTLSLPFPSLPFLEFRVPGADFCLNCIFRYSESAAMVMGQWGNGTTGQSGNGATGSLSKPAVHNFTKKHTPYFFVKCHADDLKRISFTHIFYNTTYFLEWLCKPAVHDFTKKHTPYFFVKCHADDLKRISFTTQHIS